jgi:hypothetical protein
MDVDRIFKTMNDCQVEYLLIGGMNFLVRHEPVLTFDVDLWIHDHEINRRRCEQALASLDAEWGESDADWGPVAEKNSGWLDRQPVYCLNSPSGAIDIFRSVTGLTNWAASQALASADATAAGTEYRGLSDEDMLQCQLSLEAPSANSVTSPGTRVHCGSVAMMDMNELINSESAKRLRNWDRAARWQVIQQTITWAEQQATVRRNTPATCLREQQRKLSQGGATASQIGTTAPSG